MTAPTFTVTETPGRISAIDTAGTETCGAFQPDGQQHWQLFVSRRTGLRVQGRRGRFLGDRARDASRAWVHILANHYTKGER